MHIDTERRLHDLLAANHNVTTTPQLHAIGIDDPAIHRLVRARRLIRLTRCVLSGAASLSSEGWLAAALAAGGPGSRLSHDHAGLRWGIDRIAADMAIPGAGIHVTTPTHRRPRPGLLIPHRSPSMIDTTPCVDSAGLPLTSLARTIVDLGTRRTVQQLTNVMHEAQRLDPKIEDEVERELALRPTMECADVVTLALEHLRAGQRGTRSELEDEFVRACIEFRIPVPAFNYPVHVFFGWIELDASWVDHGVNIELDSRLHDRQRARRRDPRRDAGTKELGFVTRRYRWADLRQRRAATMTAVRQLLHRRGMQT